MHKWFLARYREKESEHDYDNDDVLLYHFQGFLTTFFFSCAHFTYFVTVTDNTHIVNSLSHRYTQQQPNNYRSRCCYLLAIESEKRTKWAL